MADRKLAELFEDIKTVADMTEYESDEAEDYGIDADEGYGFYSAIHEGYLLSVVHIDGDWSAAVYGMGYGDCYGCEYADTADEALALMLDAAKNVSI